MTLLSGYYSYDCRRTASLMDKLAEQCQVGLVARKGTSNLYASIAVVAITGWRATLSEFPGNCSSLILSNIQNGIPCSMDSIDSIMKFSIALCEELEYGALFASGTSEALRDYLVSKGFEPVLEGLFNPHSISFNTFYVKKFFQREEPDV